MTIDDEQTTNTAKVPGNWAKPVDELTMGAAPSGAINFNVTGRQVTGPLKGFGQLWQKTYSVRLAGSDIAPEALIRVWKAEFPDFWPDGNRFYGTPGRSNRVMSRCQHQWCGRRHDLHRHLVIFADAESFSFMTPQGHIFAGMITFSAHEDDGVTVAQVQALVRASDPIYEMGCRVGVADSRKMPSGTARCAHGGRPLWRQRRRAAAHQSG